MKTWLAKLRISNALDAGRPLPESLRRAIAANPELARFARRSEALGRSLQKPALADASMHDSIMRAVRASVQSPQQPRRASVGMWLTATACVSAVTMICFWAFYHHPAALRQQSLAGAATVLEMSEQMPRTMPSLVMSPLSNEWSRVDRNLQNTTQVLLASFP